MIVNHRDRWLYVGSPKTGSTTLHITLCYPEFGGELWGDQHEVGSLAGYRVLASVRDPYTRALSLYRYLGQNLAGYDQTFEAYCAELEKGGYRRPYDRETAFWHWTLSEWLQDIRVDRLIHLETLDADLKAEFPVWLGRADRVNETVLTGRPVQYTPETRRLVRSWAADDFERFGYSSDQGARAGATS
jgi:hypothetical protein